jgi:ABC-type sugar transport system ATPase subunit
LHEHITGIAQELSLLPTRSVIDNVFLGSEAGRHGLVDRRTLRDRYRTLSDQAGFHVPPDIRVRDLAVAQQQQVEILRALARDAELIILDEPTASLTPKEAGALFDAIRGLRATGTTIVYVSHFLREVIDLVDRLVVMRDGQIVDIVSAQEATLDSVVTSMLGRQVSLAFPPKRPPRADARVVLKGEGLSDGHAVRGASLEVREGEILGVAGLMGSGQTELARLLFGASRRRAGRLWLDGSPFDPHSPRTAIRHRIAMIPESRGRLGLMLNRSLSENVTLPKLGPVSRLGLLRRSLERVAVTQGLERVGVSAGRQSDAVRTLSGGNQQKVLFAKWLATQPKVLIADEPTRGVDVGAKHAIYEMIVELAQAGLAVVVISSEMEEILGLAHRIIVMRGGQLVSEIDGSTATEAEVMAAAFGMVAG